MKMKGITLSALCLLVLALAPAARADAIVMSTFDTDTEGWSGVSLDASYNLTGTHAVNWNGSGGDPGGHAWRLGPQGGSTLYLRAAPQFPCGPSGGYSRNGHN